MKNKILFGFLISLMSASNILWSQTYLFVGSYTGDSLGVGIRVYELDEQAGRLRPSFQKDSLINTSFLALSSSGENLYSIAETRLETSGRLLNFKVDIKKKSLELLQNLSVEARNPVHLAMHPHQETLVVTNYTDPSINLFAIGDDSAVQPFKQQFDFSGSSVIKSRQESAHAHSSVFSADGKMLFTLDLGSDVLHAFTHQDKTLKKEGKVRMPAGSGPRHFAFHPNGYFGYSVNELSGTVSLFHFSDEKMVLKESYPTHEHKREVYRSADIHISSDGRFLYVSNRDGAENTIVVFKIDSSNGRLEKTGFFDTHGIHPRSFVLSPSGRFLVVANQFSNDIVLFSRDNSSGNLKFLQKIEGVTAPASVKMYTYQTED